MIDDRLRLGRAQSYRLFPGTPSGRIRSDVVLLALNRSRRGIAAPLSHSPCDLVKPEEAVNIFSGSDLTLSDLLKWTRRKERPVPHYRINKRTTRFSVSDLKRWLEESTTPKGA